MTDQFEDEFVFGEIDELFADDIAFEAENALDANTENAEKAASAELAQDASERIEALFESMKTYQRQLLAIISFCESPQEVEAVCDHIAEIQKHAVSVFDPANLCDKLEQAGALVKLDADGNLFDPASIEPQEVVEGGVTYYEIPEQSPILYYQSTPDALVLLAQDNREERINALLEERSEYLFVIQAILELASAEDGTQIKDIENVVLPDERFTGSKWRPNSFLNKLEEADAVAWSGSWKTTAYGRELLDGIISNTLDTDDISTALNLQEYVMTEQIATQDNETLNAFAKVCEDRAWTYGFLSRLFRREIDQEFLDQIKGTRLPAATGNDEVDEGYRLIALSLSNIQPDTLLNFAIDFTRTFIGAGRMGHSAAYPYESVYTSKDRLLMQDAYLEVVAIYRNAGLMKDKTWKEPEDHIALELEYMQVLCSRCAEALNKGDEETAVDLLKSQYNFLNDHLVSWLPMMVADMRKFSKSDLYQGLSHLLAGFMQVEEEFLHDVVEGIEEVAA